MTETAQSLSVKVAELLDEMIARVKAGEAANIDAWIAEHPEHAEELKRLAPAVVLMAQLSQSNDHPTTQCDDQVLEGTLGDFRLIWEIGRGGMGVVYEATQISLNRRVALKILPFAATMDPRHLQRFRHEAQAAAMLHHPNIVPVHGVGCERGVHYYAMQLISGRSLADVLNEQRMPSVPASNEVTADFVANDKPAAEMPTVNAQAASTNNSQRGKHHFRNIAQLIAHAADALEYAHSMGVVHRDIKPGNLLLDNNGHLWVTDFGLAKLETNANMTMTGDLVGTLKYMSPEQALARHGLVDHRTDVYSLGATLYELLTLRPAVDGADKHEILKKIAFEEPVALRKIDKSIPVELETITLKCLAKNPAERYATAKELAEDLRRWLNDQTIRATLPGMHERIGKWVRRHRSLAAAYCLAILVVTLGTLSGAAYWQWQEAEMAKTQVEESRDIAEAAKKQMEIALAGEKQARAGEAAALDRMRGVLSTLKVKQAHQAWADSDGFRARRLLESCPPESRTWEWRYVSRQFGAQVRQFRITPLNSRYDLGYGPLAFNADGCRLAFANSTGIDAWDLESEKQIIEIDRANTTIGKFLGFCPKGDLYAVCKTRNKDASQYDSPTEILVFDSDTGRIKHSIDVPYDLFPATKTAFSHKGDRLITAHYILDDRMTRPKSNTIEPKGRIFYGTQKGDSQNKFPGFVVKAWDLKTGRALTTISYSSGDVIDLVVDSDNRNVVIISSEKVGRPLSPDAPPSASAASGNIKVQAWEIDTGVETSSFVINESTTAEDRFYAVLCPQGQHLGKYKFGHNHFEIWHIGKKTIVATLALNEPIEPRCQFDPKGKYLACSGFADHSVKVWKLGEGDSKREFRGHIQPVKSITFSPDGRTLASVAFDRTIRVWDLARSSESATFELNKNPEQSLFLPNQNVPFNRINIFTGSVSTSSFSPNGQILAIGSGKQISIFDSYSAKEVKKITSHQDRIWTVAISSDGKQLASSSSSGIRLKQSTIMLWDLANGQRCHLFEHSDYVQSLAFSPDGSQLISGGQESLCVWDAKTGTHFCTFPGPIKWVTKTAFSPDGKLLATGCDSGAVRLWHWPSRELVQSLRGFTRTDIWGLAFSPDGRYLAASANDERIKIWDLRTLEEIQTLQGHRGWVGRVVFSPDGRTLASGSSEGEVKLWDWVNGEDVLTFKLPNVLGKTRALTFSPDGNRLQYLAEDGVLKIWDATPMPKWNPINSLSNDASPRP